jgi:hypothetical protein
MKAIIKLGLIFMIMLTPGLVSLLFSFEYELLQGQYIVYGLTTIAIMLGLWLIKTDFIDNIEE